MFLWKPYHNMRASLHLHLSSFYHLQNTKYKCMRFSLKSHDLGCNSAMQWQCSTERIFCELVVVGNNRTTQWMAIARLNLVKTWFSKNTFFILFFTGRPFIKVNFIIILVLEFQFAMQNPRKQTKMWIFERNKNYCF